jgi:hypothetical protein
MEGFLSMKKSFIDFIFMHMKRPVKWHHKLLLNGIDTQNARGQGYDKTANMADNTMECKKKNCHICAMRSTQS